MKLLFGTLNKGKLEEVIAYAKPFGIQIISPHDLTGDLGKPPDVEETEDTYEGNARLKAEAFSSWASMPAFSDDSGLEVDVLDGGPGLYSARFAGPQCSFEDNRAKMIQTLADNGLESSPALFRSLICVVGFSEEPQYFEGIDEGQIINVERGDKGFGYDPLFIPSGSDKTLAQLKGTGECPKTHRLIALDKMLNFLKG